MTKSIPRRIAALAEMVNAWTPCTAAGEDAHYALTNALDEAARPRLDDRDVALVEGVDRDARAHQYDGRRSHPRRRWERERLPLPAPIRRRGGAIFPTRSMRSRRASG